MSSLAMRYNEKLTAPVRLDVQYRPLKVGWCIDGTNLDDFETAVRLSHVFWGGRYNPVLSCSDVQLAKQLVSALGVDLLYNVSETEVVECFIHEYPYLDWPNFQRPLFADGVNRREPRLLDVSHPARDLYERHFDRRENPSVQALMYTWASDDPMRFAFAATSGCYPGQDVSGRDYANSFVRAFSPATKHLSPENTFSIDMLRALTPSSLTTIDLTADGGPPYPWLNPGFYLGDPRDIDDLVNFWNLRACNIELFFLDRGNLARSTSLLDAYSEVILAEPDRDELSRGVSVWGKSSDDTQEAVDLPFPVSRRFISPTSFNGLNLNPPVMRFERRAVLGVLSEDDLGCTLTFQLPEKPFPNDFDRFSQLMIASVSASPIGRSVVVPPFEPRLNRYYGQAGMMTLKGVRSERGSLGIICRARDEQLNIRAMPFKDVVSNVFKLFGIEARPSPAGLVTEQLIEQMGGLQACRVFKVAGVRKLIKKYPATKTFERTEAITTIGNNDPATGHPRFDPYKKLFLEPRNRPDLKPDDVFLFLLRKGVFRAGLKFACPRCQLDFWMSLDDATTSTVCQYCGTRFGVTSQLRDRNWAYRRSGLFGRDDNQGGGIPVALTLQQLETTIHVGPLLYTAGMELDPTIPQVEQCEVDLVALISNSLGWKEGTDLVVAECKDAGGEITEEDVRKLRKVKEAIAGGAFRVFILFSKCGKFSEEEIERCKSARKRIFESQGRTVYSTDVIMLSEDELEPYHVYERAEARVDHLRHVITVEDLAINTKLIYFRGD